MRIDGEGTTKFDASILDKRTTFTFLAETCTFDLQNRLAGKTVIDLGKIDIIRCDSCHRVCTWRAEVESDFENIGTIRNIMWWEWMS